MCEYQIKINRELNETLLALSERYGVSASGYLNDIVKRFLSAAHKMDKDGMARGYEEMGAVNLGIADIKAGDGIVNAKTDEHKKGRDLFCRPEPGSGE